MRMLFVSHVHPDSGLIGGLRLYRFARELAKRGHQIVLLCGNAKRTGDNVTEFEQRLATHDWAAPLVLSVADPREPPGTLITPRHKAQTAFNLLVRGGPFWRWRKNALVFADAIQQRFRPQVCYATFGNLDALAIARTIARRASVPWVMDIKDATTSFIRPALRRFLMPRYSDAAAVTLNAEFQRSHNPGWVDARSVVIYSGVESSALADGTLDSHQVALVGSVYDTAVLATVIRGFGAWRHHVGSDATLHYFGINGDRVRAAATAIDALDAVIVHGQVTRDALLSHCARMGALLYVRSQHGFHHKLLELAALGRPLIACPAESDEAIGLSSRHGIDLACCGSEAAISDALSRAIAQPTADTHRVTHEFSWENVSRQLEGVLTRVVDTSSRRKS